MIYLIINDNWTKGTMPKYIAYGSGSIRKIPMSLIAGADFVFYFNERGETVYYKNRYNFEAQYSDEEKVVLKLKSVLI